MHLAKFDSSRDVIHAILQPSGQPQLFTLTLSEFDDVYDEITKACGSTSVDIVLNGTWALVQFSGITNHRLRVLPDGYGRPLSRFFNWHLYLEKRDFKINRTSTTFYGQATYLSVRRFFIEELQANGLKAIFLYLFSFIVLRFTANSYNSPGEVIASANDLLIGVAAIFFSIFLLFLITQNNPLMEVSLFKRGLTHRFLEIDKKVTYSTILTLGIASLNKVLAVLSTLSIPITRQITIKVLDLLSASTALGISFMGVALLTVAQYYFRRVESIYKTALSKNILDEAFKSENEPLGK